METKDIGAPSKWIPISEPIKIAALGKLIEEAGELSSIAARCLIQGLLGTDPKTGKVNRQALIEECSDVFAMSQVIFKVIELTDVEADEVLHRAERKVTMKEAWLEMLK